MLVVCPFAAQCAPSTPGSSEEPPAIHGILDMMNARAPYPMLQWAVPIHPTAVPARVARSAVARRGFTRLYNGHNERIPVQGFAWGVRVLYEVVRAFCAAA